LQRYFCGPAVAPWPGKAMANVAKDVRDAREAGARMMRMEVKNGMKVYYHPLRFKVSETWLLHLYTKIL